MFPSFYRLAFPRITYKMGRPIMLCSRRAPFRIAGYLESSAVSRFIILIKALSLEQLPPPAIALAALYSKWQSLATMKNHILKDNFNLKKAKG